MRRILKSQNCERTRREAFYFVARKNNGWYPEVVFLTVVFSNSTVTAVLFKNTTFLLNF